MKKIIVLLLCCFFIICVRAQSDSLLMYVGEKPVSKSEFVYAYQKSGSISIHEFLSRYVKIKRWACAAEKMRLDTTQSFINRYSLYEQQVKKLVTADAQDAVVQSLDNKTAEQTSVDLNEELTDLVKFQTAYSASARVFTTCNTLLDTLVNLGL